MKLTGSPSSLTGVDSLGLLGSSRKPFLCNLSYLSYILRWQKEETLKTCGKNIWEIEKGVDKRKQTQIPTRNSEDYKAVCNPENTLYKYPWEEKQLCVRI